MARPRSEHAHQAAIKATFEVMLDAGVEGVTIEEVASRSGVAKSTLYRHFGSREELVAAAVGNCIIEHPTPDTGSLADDLQFLFGRIKSTEDERRMSEVIPMLLDAARRDPAFVDVADKLLAERRRPIMTVLKLAQMRGEISTELDLDVALAIVVGPFSYWRLVERRTATPEFIDTVLRGAITALHATVTVPT